MVAPILIFAIGNESRGDDALGPLLLRRLEAEGLPQVEYLEDFQLQVEHVTDLGERQAILFLDADVSCASPFEFAAITALHDNSYSSHAMTPSSLLHTYRQFYGKASPPAFLLRIRGHAFELGDGLSVAATKHLELATKKVHAWLADILPAK